MGWTFTFEQRRKTLIDERSTPHEWTNPDGSRGRDVILKACFKGSAWKGTWYAVHERTTTKTDGTTETERWIEVTIMRFDKREGWGYKDMEESMGPCESKCPIAYLDMVPEPVCNPESERCKSGDCSHQWARNWRARCRAYAAVIRQRRMERPVDHARYARGTLRKAMNKAGLTTEDARHAVRVVVYTHPNREEAKEGECISRSLCINWNEKEGYNWYEGGLRNPYQGRHTSKDVATVVAEFKRYVEEGKMAPVTA